MIARGFKPVGWVAAVATAALGCYMLSLNVAAERAELATVERQIIAAKQDIRSLQTELGTRGRLTQLEHWNADVLALSAPSAQQFVGSEFRLASFSQPQPGLSERAAQVKMASAEMAEQPKAINAVATDFAEPAKPVVRKASLVVAESVPAVAKPAEKPKSKPVAAKSAPAKRTNGIDAGLIDSVSAAANAERAGDVGGQ